MIWEILTFLPHWVHLANLESQQAFDFLFENHDVAEQVIKFQDFLYWLPHDILRDRKNKFYLHPLSSAILFRQLRIIHGTRHGQYNAVLLFFNLYHFLPFKDEEPHLWCCFMYKIYCTRFVPFFEQKIQGLFKDFQGHISHFSRTPFSAKKSLESTSVLLRSHHKQSYPEDLSVFAPFPWQFSLDCKVSTKIQGLSSTNYNFQDFFHNFYSKIHGLSRTFKVCANPDWNFKYPCLHISKNRGTKQARFNIVKANEHIPEAFQR